MTQKIQATFFFGLTGIEVPFCSAPGIAIGKNFRLLTDKPSIDRLVSGYTEFIGTVERSFLVDYAKAIGYRRTEIEIEPSQAGEYLNGELIRSLVELNAWLMQLWSVKDNAVDVDAGWLAAVTGDQLRVNNNRWSNSVTKADGRMSVTKFSVKELNQASVVPIEAKHWSTGPVELPVEVDQDPDTTKLTSDSPRSWRFSYFLHVGRTTNDVAMKIAHWCSGLEALVSSSQTELSHQVAERTAAALHPIGSARLETFKIVKRAYGIRSKAVHGAAFKSKDVAALKDTAVALDEICRQLFQLTMEGNALHRVLEGNSNDFEAYWLERIFTAGTMTPSSEFSATIAEKATD